MILQAQLNQRVPQPTDGWLIFGARESFTLCQYLICPMPQCSRCPYGIVSIGFIFDLMWYDDMLTLFANSSKKDPKYIQLFYFRIGSSETTGQHSSQALTEGGFSTACWSSLKWSLNKKISLNLCRWSTSDFFFSDSQIDYSDYKSSWMTSGEEG